MFESWSKDVRYALRRLRMHPTYALLTVLTLSLGVAGTAAVYSIAKKFLMDPLPYQGEEQVAVWWFERSWSEEGFHFLRPELPTFTHLAAYRPDDVTLSSGGAAARLVPGISASAELFDVLGTRPALGPGFRPGDDRVGAEPTVVLSYGLWRELGGDPGIVGERVELDGVPRTVVGVMPAGFWFPSPDVRVWLAEEMDPANGSGNYTFVGRMPEGTTVDEMGTALTRITRMLDERFDYPEQWDPTRDPKLFPVREFLMGPVKPSLLATLAAMAAILLIACVNVAALMLGQVDARGTELAVRTALGAGQGRILRQLVVESLVVGTLAGLVGAALAAAGFRILLAALPLGALAESAAVDWTIFWSAIVVALLAASAVALVPGISVARSDLQRRLTATRSGGIGGRGGRLEGGLVVAQVALALLMASGAALLIRSVANLRAIEPGVDVEGVGVVDIALPSTSEMERRPQLIGELVTALEALPGVESVAAVQRLPLRGGGDNWGIGIESRPEVEGVTTAFRMATPGYLESVGLRLIAGRGLQRGDATAREPAAEGEEAPEGTVVVNQALAEKFFPGVDPIGQRIAFRDDRWDRIVGVVENAAEQNLTDEPQPTRYYTYEQVGWIGEGQTLVLRMQPGRDPEAVLDEARRAVQAAAPTVAVREVTTMERVFDLAIGPARQVMSLLAILGGLALVLGAVGVYGVVSHFVTRRRRDWGIRLALGLPPARVVTQVVSRGGALVATGAALGLVSFLALSRVLASFLYGVEAADPIALAAATATLLGAGLFAALIPARRASRIDPALVLRDQG